MTKKHLRGFNKIESALGIGCLMMALTLRAPAAALTPGEPILLPGTHDAFDFIRLDTGAESTAARP